MNDYSVSSISPVNSNFETDAMVGLRMQGGPNFYDTSQVNGVSYSTLSKQLAAMLQGSTGLNGINTSEVTCSGYNDDGMPKLNRTICIA